MQELSARLERRTGQRAVGEANDPVAVDHEHRSPVEAEGTERSVGLGDLLVDVGEQWELEASVGGEPLMAVDVLRADAEEIGAEIAELTEVGVVRHQLGRA